MARAHYRLISIPRSLSRGLRHERTGALRPVLTVALLLAFLLPSVAPADPGRTKEGAAGVSAARDSATADSVAWTPPPDRVVLYYFHRTARCENCLLFEAYTDSLVHAAFQPELSAGVLEWLVVNLDDDGNDIFVERYTLEDVTLLSTLVVGDAERDWRPLDGIWWLVDDRQEFADYVATEIEADLEAIYGKHEPEATGALSLYRQLVPQPDGGGVDEAPAR